MPARSSNGAAKAASKVLRQRAAPPPHEPPEAARASKGRALVAAAAAVAFSVAVVAAAASSSSVAIGDQEPSVWQEGSGQPTCSANGTCNASSSSFSTASATPGNEFNNIQQGKAAVPFAEEKIPQEPKIQEPSKTGREKDLWWKKGLAFRSPHVFHLDTLNFNETITQNKQVLVAYYDRRSQSFLELQPELDGAADLLARKAAAGNNLGMLAACDVSVNTYLREREAPTMESGWQEKGGESLFKFGKPRFLPIIMVFYSNGTSRGEYTHVINPGAIAAFMHRHAAPLGGRTIEDAAAARKLLKEPGPLAFGCELEPESEDFEAFRQSARKLHGSVLPVFAPASVCTEVLKAGPPWPQVVWAAGAAASEYGIPGRSKKDITRMLENGTIRTDAERLSKWLREQKAEVLEEMTPDNSHLYLDSPEPLVIFLADPTNSAAMERGNTLLGRVNEGLQAVEKFRLVWSDCRAFGDQFAATNECPVVVVVRTSSLEWNKISLAKLGKGRSGEQAEERLLEFLLDVTKPWREERLEKERKNKKEEEEEEEEGEKEKEEKEERPKEEKEEKEEKEKREKEQKEEREKEEKEKEEKEEAAAAAAAGPKNATGTEQAATPVEEDEDEEADGDDDDGEAVFTREKFLNSVDPMVVDPHGQKGPNHHRGYQQYSDLLTSLLFLRRSYRAVYEKTLPFDFSDIDKVQKLHKHMASLARTPGEVRTKVMDRKKKRALYRAIEERALFVDLLKKNDSSAATYAFAKALNGGYKVLRRKFSKLMAHLHKHAAAGTLGIPEATPLEVERRHSDELSMQEFVEKYARPGKPVIISGLNLTGDQPEWSLEFFRERCNHWTDYRKKNPKLDSWGRLEHAGRLPLAEFIDTFRSNKTRRKWYLHDWALPPNCPEAFGPPPYKGFRMPRYFAGDYFQRAGFEGYQHSWPSLFIGSSDTESAMHIDSGGTNFWLYLLSGKKEWRFFPTRDVINLYKHPQNSAFFVDAFEPDTKDFPLYKYAQMYVGTQEPGDLMFIPGGNPHAVRNLEDIHGVSMNYVDASNVWIFLWHMIDESKWKTVELFTDNVSFPHGLRSDQEALSFGEWKSTRWWDLSYDIH